MFRSLASKLYASVPDKTIFSRSNSALSAYQKTSQQFGRHLTCNRYTFSTTKHTTTTNNKPSSYIRFKKSLHTSAPYSVYQDDHYWDYSKQYGPSNWENVWPAGTYQSPIDIKTDKVVYDGSLGGFNLDETPVAMTCANNGCQAVVSPNPGEPDLPLSGGPLIFDGYKFASFHFHHGEENTCGCEHTVDGHRYAAELHIVHFNPLLDAQDGEKKRVDNIAVLGIFLDASDEHADNPALDVVFKMLDNILYQGQKYVSTDAFSVYDLLPANRKDYYTYPGSLTTPPLSENVVWTVFKDPIQISTRQQKEFTKLYAVEDDMKDTVCVHDPCTRSSDEIPQPPNICNNFREVQPLHDRVVRSTFKYV